jgi:hypothetical protein
MADRAACERMLRAIAAGAIETPTGTAERCRSGFLLLRRCASARAAG